MEAIRNSFRPQRNSRVIRDPLRFSALFYLREALLEERYEECAEIIEAARELGANVLEIQNILEVPQRPL
ncbi:MAG: hypothetical protein H6757_03255 [Candidatus Omnitrophica bacterium]|nr:hypothetical protein [Candidatus Omnitrophota bacterium]